MSDRSREEKPSLGAFGWDERVTDGLNVFLTKRFREPITFQDSLKDLSQSMGLGNELGLVQEITAKWPSLVGEMIAQNCKPLGVKEQTLKLQARDRNWQVQVDRFASVILDRLNAEIPEANLTKFEFIEPAKNRRFD